MIGWLAVDWDQSQVSTRQGPGCTSCPISSPCSESRPRLRHWISLIYPKFLQVFLSYYPLRRDVMITLLMNVFSFPWLTKSCFQKAWTHDAGYYILIDEHKSIIYWLCKVCYWNIYISRSDFFMTYNFNNGYLYSADICQVLVLMALNFL